MRKGFSVVSRWGLKAAAFAFLAVALLGCATLAPRNVLPEQLADEAEFVGIPGIRIWGDASTDVLQQMVRAEAPEIREAARRHHRTGKLLAISGGAGDAAFGAGLLVGWTATGTRPSFDIVTGISAGGLIAPFAFLGPERDHQLTELFTRYQQSDIVAANVLPGLLGGSSVGDSTPLATLIAKYVDRRFLQEVARERMKGRALIVGTTNLDAQRPVLWDMGRIAMSGHPKAIDLFRKILLASAAIPGAFPPVRFEVNANGRTYEELHVDGGITQQVFLLPTSFAFARIDRQINTAISRQLYVIRNGKIEPEWQSVDEKLMPIAQRSISTLIKHQGIGDLYRMYAMAQRDRIDFNLAAIPGKFSAKSDGLFDKAYTVPLFNLGYRQGKSGYKWMKAPPGWRPSSVASGSMLKFPIAN